MKLYKKRKSEILSKSGWLCSNFIDNQHKIEHELAYFRDLGGYFPTHQNGQKKDLQKHLQLWS
jgi:hypothetical protein